MIGVGVLTLAASASADTLFLRSGKTLKIDALGCDLRTCRASLPGGHAEIRATDVLRVEADEEVDPQPAIVDRSGSEARSEPPAFRTVEQLIADAAHNYALPRSLVRAVANAESALNPSVVSPKGALGIMQLMPQTARELGVVDAFDPAQNIDAGARLLREHLERYQGRVAEALAAYNAGIGAVAKHKGVPPFRETRGYIRRVVKDYEKGENERAASASEKKEP